jgi:hypothetical protein
MRTLKNRLAQLEQADAAQHRRTRCAQCRSWPAVQGLEIDTAGNETWRDPDAPAVCLRCGWRPVLVKVVEVEDWRRVSRPPRKGGRA